MNSKGFLVIIVCFSFISINLITGPGCANMFPPEGGRRDSIPPQLLKANPPDSAKQFHSNLVTFTFDEFVQLQDQYQNVIISPIPQTRPNIDAKLRAVTVKFKDSLEANTTPFATTAIPPSLLTIQLREARARYCVAAVSLS